MKRTEHTQKWLDALRSGKYEQGFGGLRVKDTFCSLGVACDVFAPNAWVDRGLYQNHIFGSGTMQENGMEAFGMSKEEAIRLMYLNDGLSKTFPEIADAIEKMLEPEGV